MNNTIPEILEKLKAVKRAAIFCHSRPDGDALGSGLAVMCLLRGMGKEAYMVCDEKVPDKFMFLPAMEEVRHEIPGGEYDTFIAVDCADMPRMGTFADAYYRFRGTTICIDHHISNKGFAKYNYVMECCAVCELLTDMVKEAGWEPDQETANLLMLGIVTDSGNFTHQDVTEKTYMNAAFLRAHGADPHTINYNMFDRQVKVRALLYGRVMNDMRFFNEDRIAVIVIRDKDTIELGADKSLTEGFVDFPLSVDGVEVAISMLEKNDEKGQYYKVSFRSKGRVNVSDIACSFGGGGHVLASGCVVYGTEEQAVKQLVDAVSKAV